MFELLKVRRGRHAAIAAIAPHVEQSRLRLHGISDLAWLDPYMVGFLSTLITLEAMRKTGNLGSHALGLVQAEAWAGITGLKSDLIGEEICALSAAQNGAFAVGCRNAAAFLGSSFDVLLGAPAGAMTWPGSPREESEPDASIALHQMAGAPDLLWAHYFEAHIH